MSKYYKGIGQVEDHEVAECSLVDEFKSAELEARSLAKRAITKLGQTLVAENADPELVQAFRDLWTAIDETGSHASVQFRGKRISVECTVFPSLERRGIKVY